jgi:hypothetical protein
MPRRKVFDAPGKAMAWGLAACLACSLFRAPFAWTLLLTIIAALGGCFNG